MKKIVVLPVTIILTILLSAITVVFAVDNNDQSNEFIVKDQADVTGDGTDDSITITGKPYENEQEFLKGLKLKLKTSEGKSFKIKLEDGYKPNLYVNDFNQDGVNELFISVPTGASDGLTQYYLYSFKNSKKTKLAVPEPLTIISQYEDNYKASLKIDETSEAVTFNLIDRQATYDNLGLYNEGKLNEPMELMVMPYSKMEPARLADGKFGLKGVQKIGGVSEDDEIGFVETSWTFENKKWVLMNSSIKEVAKNKKKN